MRRIARWVITSGVLTVLLTLLVGFASAAEKVVFRLNWRPEGEGEHAIFYVAKSKGFYANLGLDVEIQVGSGSGDTVSRVSAGTVDIGYADAGTILVGRGAGSPLKMVAMVYQQSPFTLWTRKDTGIKSPKDLEGRTIGAPTGDAQRVMFPAFAQAVGINPAKVEWVTITPAAKIQTLAAKRIDATVHFIDQIKLYTDAVGADNLVYFRWTDYGVNPYGNAIFVTEETLSKRRDVVKRFLEATLKAWQWTIANPKEAIAIMRESVPAADAELVYSMLVEEIKLMDAPVVRRNGLGYMDPQRIAETVAMVKQYFEIKHDFGPNDVYTNELLTPVSWPK